MLKRECKLAEAITNDPRTALDILMVDRTDNSPQDLLGGSAFQALLEEARATYDFVIVDTPPQGAVSDVLLMAEFVDATLLAVRWNATPPTVVRWTLEAFGTRGLMPQGIFLNGVDYLSLTKKDPDVRTAYRSTRSYYPS